MLNNNNNKGGYNLMLGKGFSRRNISYMRRFFGEFKRVHICALLTWTHYRTLLSVDDVVFRKNLELFAIENKLPNPELAKSVKSKNSNAEILNIGIGTNMLQSTRLRGVYAAELGTQDGKQAMCN